MFGLVTLSGPFGYILVIIGLAILAMFVLKVSQLLRGTAEPGPAWDSGLNSILFWGAFAAVLGFLGQCLGIYEALKAISEAEALSPSVMAVGFFVSFTSTLIGLIVLVIAALAWFVLRAWSNRALRTAVA